MSCWSSQIPADGEMQGDRRTESDGYMPYYGAPVPSPYPYSGGPWNGPFPVGGVPPWTQMRYPPPYFGFPPSSYYPYAPYPNHHNHAMTPQQQSNMGMRQEEMQNVLPKRHAPPFVHDQMTAESNRAMTATQQLSSSRSKAETKSAHGSEEIHQPQSDEHGNTTHDGSMESPEDSDMPYCRICDFVPKGVAKKLKLKAHHYRHLENDFKIFRFECSCGLRTNSLEEANNHTEEEPDEHKMNDRRDAMEQYRRELIIGKSKEEYQKALTNFTKKAKCETTSTIKSKQQTRVMCELCLREFPLMPQLRDHQFRLHMAALRQIFRYVCSESDCAFKSGSYRQRHEHQKMTGHQVEDMEAMALEQLTKAIANGPTPNDLQLKQPTNVNAKCLMCDKTFSEGGNLRQHELAVHIGNERKVYRFVCKGCTFATSTMAVRLLHELRTHHEFDNRTALVLAKLHEIKSNCVVSDNVSHSRDLRPKQPPNTSEMEKCLMCNKMVHRTSIRQHQLAVHMGSERKIYRFVCKGCTFATGDTTTRHRHQRRTKHEIEDRRALVLAKLQEVKNNWDVSRGADNVDHAHSATHEQRDKTHKAQKKIASKRVHNPFRVLKATKKKRRCAIFGAVQSESSDDDEMEEYDGQEDSHSNANKDVGRKRRI